MTSDTTTELETSAPAATSPPAGDSTRAPAGAPAPTAAPPVTAWAIILGVLLAALGLLLLRDAAVVAGLLQGTPVSTKVVDRLKSVTPQPWYLPAGILVALLGLWLVVAALRPRPRRDLAVGDGSLVWLTPSATASIARAAASVVDGVVEARASATRRTVRVLARTTGPDVGPVVTAAVEEALRGLASMPRVRVTTRPMGERS